MIETMALEKKQQNADELVKQAKTDVDALGRLYDLFYERIFSFCVHRLFDKHIAEDTTGEVFLTVARKIRTFQGQTFYEFRKWIYTIAVNKSNGYLRKTLRRKQLLAESAKEFRRDSDCSEKNDNPFDWPKLYKAILKLKPKQQTVLTLRYFEEMPLEQIAKIVKTKESTIRVILHRALKKLKADLPLNINGDT
jgi:RNA polymerase sigma-70 factor (ECF subfamily)